MLSHRDSDGVEEAPTQFLVSIVAKETNDIHRQKYYDVRCYLQRNQIDIFVLFTGAFIQSLLASKTNLTKRGAVCFLIQQAIGREWVWSRAIETRFKKPRFFRFKKPKKPEKLGF